jgi:hypothetical protein
MKRYLKTIILMIAISIFVGGLLNNSNQVLSKPSPFQSGYNHGSSDAHKDPSHWYILQHGKGFAFHTKAFNNGYVAGYCAHSPPGSGSDADEATFSCP